MAQNWQQIKTKWVKPGMTIFSLNILSVVLKAFFQRTTEVFFLSFFPRTIIDELFLRFVDSKIVLAIWFLIIQGLIGYLILEIIRKSSGFGKVFKKFTFIIFATISVVSVVYFIFQIYFYKFSAMHNFSIGGLVICSLLIVFWQIFLWISLWPRISASGGKLHFIIAFIATLGFLCLAVPYIHASTWAWDYGGPIPEPFPFGPLLFPSKP